MPEEPTTPKDEFTKEPSTDTGSTDFDLEGSSTTAPDSPAESPFGASTPTETPTPFTPAEAPVIGSAPAFTPAKKPRKTGMIVGIIAAAALVVFGGGGVLAYNVWYQNPQKVITDAIMNAVTAKTAVFTGTLSVDNDQVKVGVEINAKGDDKNSDLSAKLKVTYQEKEYAIDAAAIYAESGDIYLKVEKLDDVATLIKEQFASYDTTGALSKAIDKMVAKIDGTWIKISADDLKSYSEEASSAQTCIGDATKKFKDDKEAISEISTLYQNNQFITVKKDLGSKDGSIGYEIESDKDKAKAFATGLENTKIYKALHDCDESFTISSDDLAADESKATGTVQIWVDAWSHQFTKIELNGESDGTKVNATILPIFNKAVTVEVPTTSTTLTQLQEDFTQIFSEASATE